MNIFFVFFAVCSAPRCLQHIAVPLLKFNTASSVDMEFNNKRQRLTDRIFDKDDAYANDADEDSMDYDYDSGVGGSILSSSFGGGGIGGGGIGAPISSAYLSSRGPTCEYEEAAEKKRKAAVARFVALSSGKDHCSSTFSATKVVGKKRTTTAASFLLSPPPPPPPSPAVGNQSPALVDISDEMDPEVAAAAAASAAAANPPTAKVKARKVAKVTKATTTTTTTTTTTATKRVTKAGKKLKPATAAETSAAEAAPPSTSNESVEAAVAAADDIPASVAPAVVSQTVKKIVDYTSETEEMFLVSACALG